MLAHASVGSKAALFTYTLRQADNALILGHRLSEWCGHGPTLEEDIALANMGLDLIGQARSLYSHAGEIEGTGRDEDRLAYHRDVSDWRNILLVEQPKGDFAVTIIRQLLFSAFAHPYCEQMMDSKDAQLAAIAAKSVKEMAYHVRHSAEWVIRLGDGTDESRARCKAALEELWPYTGEMFETDAVERELIAAGIAVDPESVHGTWSSTVQKVLTQAGLDVPREGWMQTGGRQGRHSEHLGFILAEMQHLQRSHPDATW
ncbi:MAG: 1,2-phenylacetyl-CoA epoxidase subunit PaaC [Bosea sp. (in: a-proteobacteria)]